MLTNRRLSFVNHLVEHGDVRLAAEQAGFSDPVYGYQLVQDATVAAELRLVLDRAKAEDVVLGRRVLRSIALATDLPAGARVTAARTLLEYAGAMHRTADASTKDPGEMTTDELRSLVSQIDAELGNRAKPVDGTDAAPVPSEVADMVA